MATEFLSAQLVINFFTIIIWVGVPYSKINDDF